MGNHISGAAGRRELKTFSLLDQIVTVLGGTKLSFWPFIQATGTTLLPYGSGTDGVLLTASSAIESILDPFQHVGGVYSLKNDGTTNWLQAADNANFSFGDATIDSPFSLGAWILVEEALGTIRSILAKYAPGAAVAREYELRFSATGKLIFELFDESAGSNEVATSTGTAITPYIWQFITMTYDGGETAPVINLYLNGVSVHDGTSVETGAYVAMEDLGQQFRVGARDDGAGAANQVLQGRVALPFVTGSELTAANVTTLYGLGQELLGV